MYVKYFDTDSASKLNSKKKFKFFLKNYFIYFLTHLAKGREYN